MIHTLQILCSEMKGSLMQNCGFGENFLGATAAPFEFITGGLLASIFWGVISFSVYLRYRNGVMAGMVGVVVLLGTSVVIPVESIVMISLLTATVVGTALFYIIFRSPRTGN